MPTPTATPGSTRSCPIRAEVCEAARIIQSALEANNVEPLMSATSFAEYDCPAVRAQGLGGPYPLCDDTPGERRAGFREANDVQGFVIDRSKIESHWMMMIDSSTSGFDWRVRSIACRVPAPGDDCSAALVVLGKQDADGGIVAQQSAALFEISFAQGRTFQITAFTAAFVLGDAPILLHGGATPANPGHSSIFGFGPFHRVRVQ